MIEVRAATAADLVSIATIHIACWRSAYRGILPDSLLDELNLEERLQRWNRWMAQENRYTFVATDSDPIVGFTSFAIEYAFAEISHVYVDPARQRSGAGRLLLGHDVEVARHHGCDALRLWVLEDNAQARAFYERFGFTADGERKTDPAFLGNDAAEVRYQLSLR
jgi:ribosomal protein S18 acetylase RimI-like enzyme